MECVKIEQRSGIEIRTIRDENGVFTRLYRERGKLLPRLTLEGKYVEQMKAFRSLEKDLRNLLAWAKILNDTHQKLDTANNVTLDMESDDAAIAKALFFAILALYGRCFTSAQNRKFTFDRKHVPEEFRTLHDELMHARHNFAAHKGQFEPEDCKIALIVAPHRKGARTGVFSELQQPYFSGDLLSKGNENKFVDLCNALREVVDSKYSHLCDKIDHDFVRITPNDYWKKADGKTVDIDSFLQKST